jgi:hypothetical protein
MVTKNGRDAQLSISTFFYSRPVSRVLFNPSFTWSCHHWQDHTTYPPALDEQPLAPVYMVSQPIRCTASSVTTGTGELLPHLFTLVPIPSTREGRLFSVTLLYPHGYLPVRKYGALCCPDFPPPTFKSEAMEQPAALQR